MPNFLVSWVKEGGGRPRQRLLDASNQKMQTRWRLRRRITFEEDTFHCLLLRKLCTV